jgi:two-component system OmpR family response regulator
MRKTSIHVLVAILAQLYSTSKQTQHTAHTYSAKPHMTRVLTIEDDETTAQEIIAELSSHGFEVDWVSNGRDGLNKAMTDQYDAVTLDRMLPELDGLAIVKTLRSVGVNTPVLMISALSDVDERVRGLRAGGDDYMTKPFASEEMSARLEVLLRRHRGTARETMLRFDTLEIDVLTRSVRRGTRELRLSPAEYKLLEFMLRNSGQILTRTMIFEEVWGYHFDPGTNLIDVHIARLRRKVDGPGNTPLIQTVRGTGYLLGHAN